MMWKCFFIFVFLQLCLLADDLECSSCKKKIKENASHIKSSSGAIYCNKTCSEAALPKCDLCGKLSKKYITVDAKVYCGKECASKAGPHCTVCSKALFGTQYLKDKKGTFCNKECYLKITPNCFLCSEKSMDRVKIAGHDYCDKCGKLNKCDACGLPSNGSKLDDGREICKSCSKLGVKDNDIAQKIYLEVKEKLSKKFNIETTKDLPMSLIDKNEMIKIKGASSHAESGFYRQKESQHFKKKVDSLGNEQSRELVRSSIEDRHIYILTFLPENVFRNVVAHELMHNWQMSYYPQIEDDKIEEGLAEYMSYLLNVDEKDMDLIERKMENKDPIYGDGFRLVKAWDQGKGIEDIKSKLKELYGLPKVSDQ
jgi:hypothetical protein